MDNKKRERLLAEDDADIEAIDALIAEHAKKKSMRTLTKIISGGQTGADIAGLKAAKRLGLATGGTAPPHFGTSKGSQEGLLKSFGLNAIPLTTSWESAYCSRSMLNVDNADATVAFRVKASPGTDKTIGYCVTKRWQNSGSLS